ncbi:uncharacterized protein LOC126786462 [Argentina anserina]|uniref:uncharacterized protein LOC126786462 n=1 Tax=Argentina anserina TaxID=57926 RepID=UPI0021766DBA|nr:uncharacterized protein LOC126786462 [Potentilla anserina]
MSRLLTLRSFRSVVNSVVTSQKQSYQETVKYGTVFRIGLQLPRHRYYREYTFPNRGEGRLSLYNATKSFYQSRYSRNFCRIPAAGSAMRHNAQIIWKRLSEKFHPNGGYRFSPIDRIARAFRVNRYGLLFPGIFAVSSGKIAWAQRTLGERDHYASPPPQRALYTRAEHGHAIVRSVVFSVFEGIILLLRAIYLAVLFSPSIIMAPFAESCGPQFRRLWLRVVLRTLEKAGPAFIKWGQWAATRPDLFPRDICAKLSELHTKAPEHSFAYTKKTIEKSFGRKLPEIFENFEEAPVASGSIAQVHRATLKYRYPGKQVKPVVVAVKVRHPGVGESIRRDFVIINLVAKMSKFVPALKWWRLDESVQQFSVFMMSQVDLAREAANLSRFTYNFRRWKDVSFPKPVYPLVHPAVLVETYEQGECVSHYVDDLQGHERIKSALAHIGTHALLKMLLVDNFIHADMHPGNILVRVAQNKPSQKRLFKSKPHVIFLDVGMTAELSRSDRVNLLEFFKAVACRDGRIAAECTLRLSKQQNCPNPKAFIEEVEESFTFWGTPEGDLVHPADCMQQLLEKVRRHRVNVDGNVCTVMVTTLVLEGWQRKLDPAYNVMHTLQTLLLKADWAKSLSYTIEGLMAP